MQLAVRSYLATGVAIAGVGAVAISPVAPSMPDVKVPAVYSSPAVGLSALVNPIEEYAIVFNQALQNVAGLAERIAQDPAPILSQIVTNQLNGVAGIATFVGVFGESVVGQLVAMPEQFEIAVGQLAAGEVTLALNTVVAALLAPIMTPVIEVLLMTPDIYAGLQTALTQPLTNLLNVVNLTSYPNVLNLLGPLLAPIQMVTDVTTAVGAAGDGIVAGMRAGNLEEIANALLSLGPDVTQAILNGNPLSGEYSAGLLGPQGIIAGLLTIRDLIAEAITPPQARPAALAVSDVTVAAGARTVTLDVTPAANETAGGAETGGAQPVSAPHVPAAADADAEGGAEGDTAEKVVAPEEAVTPAEDGVVAESPEAVSDDADAATGTTPAKAGKQVRTSTRSAIKTGDRGTEAGEGVRGKRAKAAKSESDKGSRGSDRSTGSGSDSRSSE